MNNYLEKVFIRVSMIGARQGDSEELRLQKSLPVICAIPFSFAGAAWGIMYIIFGENLVGLIPLSYSVISIISIMYFGITHKFQIFRFSQLLLILLLPFALMLALGGFVSGSAVILWGLISPLGAMLFDKQSNAPRWLLAYILLVIIGCILQPWLRVQNNLSVGEISLFFVINIIGVGSLIYLMVYYFVGKKNFFQARSESLLLNILPKEIVEELKANGSAEAKQFDTVTVMFTDFKNFTQISEKLSPSELVAEIDKCFKAFDNIIDKYNIEKIKTIGDSYMAAGGLPVPNKTNATDVVNASIEIQNFMYNHSQKKSTIKKNYLKLELEFIPARWLQALWVSKNSLMIFGAIR